MSLSKPKSDGRWFQGMKDWGTATARIIFGFVFASLICEVIFRLFWNPPYLDQKYKRDDLAWLQKNVILDRYGYRDRDFDYKKKGDVFRIYIVGDSYTYGWYIDDQSLSYPKILEKLLQEKYGKDLVEVINAARPGFDFAAEVERFRNEGTVFSPDLVLVGINSQDLASREFPPNFIMNRFVRNLRLYQLTFGNLERMRVAQETDKEIKMTYQDGSPQLQKAEVFFRDLHDLSVSIGAEAAIVVFPEYNPAYPNGPYRYGRFHKQLSSLAEKYSVYVVDLLESFGNVNDKRELVLNPIDSHPSVLADRLAAEWIAKTLNFEELLKKPRVKFSIRSEQICFQCVLPDFNRVISINLPGWVYFDRKFGLDIQKEILGGEGKQVLYLEDSLRTGKAFTHDGWPGAKIDYHLYSENGVLKVPRSLYGYKVTGVSQITGFWREDGALNSRDFKLEEVEIWRDKDYIYADTSKYKKRFSDRGEFLLLGLKCLFQLKSKPDCETVNYDLFSVVLDVAVSQFDIDGGKVVSFFTTFELRGNLSKGQRRLVFDTEGKVGSLPKFTSDGKYVGYVWVNDKLEAVDLAKDDLKVFADLFTPLLEDSVFELPIAQGQDSNNGYPVVEYR